MTMNQEADYGTQLIWRLQGARIRSMGMNADGEIFITTDKGIEIRFGVDEQKELALYEVQKKKQ